MILQAAKVFRPPERFLRRDRHRSIYYNFWSTLLRRHPDQLPLGQEAPCEFLEDLIPRLPRLELCPLPPVLGDFHSAEEIPDCVIKRSEGRRNSGG